MNSMLENNLRYMLKDIENYKQNRDTLLYNYIDERLKESMQSYIHDLTMAVISMGNMNALKIFKDKN